MEFGDTFTRRSGEMMTTALAEGGGIAIGFLGAGAIGKWTENYVKPNVVPTSPTTDKIVAWIVNNAPKIGAWYLVHNYGPRGTPRNMTELMTVDAKKAMFASVVVDSIMRATNKGAPGVGFKLFGIQLMPGEGVSGTNPNPQLQANLQANLHKVIQENSSLRGQLNQALAKLASNPQIIATPYPDHDRKYGMMQTTPEAENRRKEFGAMESPIIDERNTRFGQMNKSKLNFAGEEDRLASMYGML